jgi:hypothetical protein
MRKRTTPDYSQSILHITAALPHINITNNHHYGFLRAKTSKYIIYSKDNVFVIRNRETMNILAQHKRTGIVYLPFVLRDESKFFYQVDLTTQYMIDLQNINDPPLLLYDSTNYLTNTIEVP